MIRATKMIWAGGIMLIAGWLVIFAIVLGLVRETFFLNFLGYGVSFGGLLVGLFGVLNYARPRND